MNLIELFKSKETEIKILLNNKIKALQKENPETIKLIEEEDLFLGGPELCIWILSFLCENRDNEPISLIFNNFEQSPNTIKMNKTNTIYSICFINYSKKETLFTIPLIEFLQNSFPYNYQQIAYDFKRNKILFTDYFLDFLENKKILNTSYQYNYNSLLQNIKIVNKFNFINYNEDEENRNFALSLVPKFLPNNVRNRKQFINQKINKAETIKSFINKNIDDKTNNTTYNPYLNYIIENQSKKHFDNINGTLCLNISQASHPLVYYIRFFDYIYENIDDLVNYNIPYLTKGNYNIQEKKSLLLLGNWIDYDFIKENEAIISKTIQQDFNKETFIQFENTGFLTNHSRLLNFIRGLIKNNWSIQNILLLMHKIYFINKKAIIGYIEGLNPSTIPFAKNPNEVANSFNTIINNYWTIRKKGERTLVKKLDLSNFDLSYHFKELTTNIELELEGEDMNHCVGGYSEQINNNHRIFHIKSIDGQSTAELKKNSQWDSIQHKGINNNNPCQKNNELLNSLLLFLNNKPKKLIIERDILLEINPNHELFNETQKKFLNSYQEFNDFHKFINYHLEYKSEIDFRQLIQFDQHLNIDIEEQLTYLHDVLNNKKFVIGKIINSSYENKDSYKENGFIWNKEYKVWWRILNPITDKFNLNIELSSIFLQLNNELIIEALDYAKSKNMSRNKKYNWLNLIKNHNIKLDDVLQEEESNEIIF